MATQTVALKSTVENLPNNSDGQGYSLLATITAAMLTASVADDLNSFTITIPAKSRIGGVLLDLRTAFENTASGANNTTTVSIGDTAGATTHLAAKEVNANGSTITLATGDTAKVYTSADTLKVIFTPKSSTALTALNKGELRVYVKYTTDGAIG